MKIFGIILISLFIFSCESPSGNTVEETSSENPIVTPVVEKTNPHDLILIAGEKWVIDEGMRVSIDSIEMRMQAFNGTTMEGYELLSEDLAHHTKSVISNCTMKGQAHDELHKWLLPFIDLRKELKGITSVEEGEEIATELNSELIIFNTYFE